MIGELGIIEFFIPKNKYNNSKHGNENMSHLTPLLMHLQPEQQVVDA